MKRAASLVGALAVAASGFFVWQAPAARAEAPEATGWWWRGAPPPAPGALGPPVQSNSPRPQVPPGGLYVAGEGTYVSPPDPRIPVPPDDYFVMGVSGLRLTVGENAIVNDIVLEIDQDATGRDKVQGTPAVRACVAQYLWTAEEGGRMETAPPSDCALGVSYGGAAGSKVAIPAQQLVRDGVLNIVLEPAAQSAFQVVFKKPGPQSITVSRFDADGGGGDGEVPNPIPFENFAPDAGTGLDLGGVGPSDPPLLYLGGVPPAPPAPASVAPPVASGPSRTVPAASTPEVGRPRPDRPPRLVAALILTGLVLVYLGLLQGGQLPPLPGPLGRWLPSGRSPADAVPLQGIGRFARIRSGEPPAL